MTDSSAVHPRGGLPAAYLRALKGRQGLRSWYVLAFQLPFLPELLAVRAPQRFAGNLRAFGMRDEDAEQVAREVVRGIFGMLRRR